MGRAFAWRPTETKDAITLWARFGDPEPVAGVSKAILSGSTRLLGKTELGLPHPPDFPQVSRSGTIRLKTGALALESFASAT
jgi:hypothetical protein